jgi:hypothetical protein
MARDDRVRRQPLLGAPRNEGHVLDRLLDEPDLGLAEVGVGADLVHDGRATGRVDERSRNDNHVRLVRRDRLEGPQRVGLAENQDVPVEPGLTQECGHVEVRGDHHYGGIEQSLLVAGNLESDSVEAQSANDDTNSAEPGPQYPAANRVRVGFAHRQR